MPLQGSSRPIAAVVGAVLFVSASTLARLLPLPQGAFVYDKGGAGWAARLERALQYCADALHLGLGSGAARFDQTHRAKRPVARRHIEATMTFRSSASAARAVTFATAHGIGTGFVLRICGAELVQ